MKRKSVVNIKGKYKRQLLFHEKYCSVIGEKQQQQQKDQRDEDKNC